MRRDQQQKAQMAPLYRKVLDSKWTFLPDLLYKPISSLGNEVKGFTFSLELITLF